MNLLRESRFLLCCVVACIVVWVVSCSTSKPPVYPPWPSGNVVKTNPVSIATGPPMPVLPPAPNLSRPVPQLFTTAIYAAVVTPPTNHAYSLSLGCDPNTDPRVTGLEALVGQRSGQYQSAGKITPATNVFNITLDDRQPAFIAVRWFYLGPSGEQVSSKPSNEVLSVPTNCVTFAQVTNGAFMVIGYGHQGTTNRIYSGLVTGLTNLLASIPGTNGPWFWSQSPAPGIQNPVSGFFKIVTE